MHSQGLPGFSYVDHVALTVPDLDAAVTFYTDLLGGIELYRVGPLDAAELPLMPDGRDWSEAHVNVGSARLTISMLHISDHLRLQLLRYEKPANGRAEPPRNCDIGAHHIAFKVQDIDVATAYLKRKNLRVMAGPFELREGPAKSLRIQYFLDPWGNQLELVEYGRYSGPP